jgi:hypothetical protein
MARRRGESNDQRLTIYLPEGAVPGRGLEFHETGMVAYVDGAVPAHERFRFTLHLPGGVIAGDAFCIGQEDRECRLQFASLTEDDRERLAPFMSQEP